MGIVLHLAINVDHILYADIATQVELSSELKNWLSKKPSVVRTS